MVCVRARVRVPSLQLPQPYKNTHKKLKVRGFNQRAWASAHPGKRDAALAALSQLVAAGMLVLEFAEYALEEWRDALEHARDAPGGSRALLRLS